MEDRLPLQRLLLLASLALGSAAWADEAADDAEGASAPAAQEEAGAGAGEPAEEEESFEERLDRLLAEAEAEDIYGETQHCLYRRRFSHIDVVSEDILIFSRGKSYWINHLKRPCRGLRRDMVIHTQVRGINSLCSNDLVYANWSSDLQEGMGPAGRPAMVRAVCSLGEFQSIPQAYGQALQGLPE